MIGAQKNYFYFVQLPKSVFGILVSIRHVVNATSPLLSQPYGPG